MTKKILPYTQVTNFHDLKSQWRPLKTFFFEIENLSWLNIIFFNVPFLAIPLPKSKDNHQFYNAKDYFDKKLCWLTNQSDYKKENLKDFILNLIQNPDDYFEKKNNMIKFSYQNTWNNINQKLLALINEN